MVCFIFRPFVFDYKPNGSRENERAAKVTSENMEQNERVSMDVEWRDCSYK